MAIEATARPAIGRNGNSSGARIAGGDFTPGRAGAASKMSTASGTATASKASVSKMSAGGGSSTAGETSASKSSTASTATASKPNATSGTHATSKASAANGAGAAGRTSKKKTGGKLQSTLLALVVPALVVILWVVATSTGTTPESILPRITTVGNTLATLAQDGTIPSDLSISLIRVVEGYLIAAVIGITLGSLMGMSRIAREMLLPTITALRQIPLLAWIPLLILWCGIGETSKVVFIVMAAFFPILSNTLAGVASTPLEYVEVARLNKLSRWKTFTRVYLPHALPQIQTGLKLGLGVSWMAVVGAELIASTSGVGYRMSYARTLMQSDVVIAYMVVVGVVGIVMDKVVGAVFSALTPWERKGRERA